MYQTLYRKYRPTNFSEVIGQKVIVQTLKNAIKNSRLSHAYLFSGPRGTGKTSIAKILAKTVNCENLKNFNPCNNCDSCEQINNNQSIDIIEIDAASNNGVDEIRELRNKVSLVPSTGKYKVYIIDEVHMLTTGAFNALLKTLEEPPKHVIFILATTEPHKIPMTILSRCQCFDFKKISADDMKSGIKNIINKENVSIEEKAMDELIRLSDGCMRDCLSILDQLLAYCDNIITLEAVHEINGTLLLTEMKDFIINIINKNTNILFEMIDNFDNYGKNFIKLTEELILYLKDVLIKNIIPEYANNIDLMDDYYKIDNIKCDDLFKYIDVLNKSLIDIQEANNPKIVFELNILKLLDLTSNNIKTTEEINKIIENKEPTKKKNDTQLPLLIEARLNNTLCYFDKKYYLNIKNTINILSNYLIDPKYGKYVSIIMDGELKAAGNNYMIFVYSNKHIANDFNENILDIEKTLQAILGEHYSVIATDVDKWNILKEEYNKKQKQYKLIEEPILNSENEKNNILNDIEQNFNDIIEYS